jgi:hypothetical protein
MNGTQSPTSFPILFTSNTVDPLTPLKSYVSSSYFSPSAVILLIVTTLRRARKMSSLFPGSVLLLQEAVGVRCSSSLLQKPLPKTKTDFSCFSPAIARRRQPGRIVLLLWSCPGVPSGRAPTIQHCVLAGLRTFRRSPCLSDWAYGRFPFRVLCKNPEKKECDIGVVVSLSQSEARTICVVVASRQANRFCLT